MKRLCSLMVVACALIMGPRTDAQTPAPAVPAQPPSPIQPPTMDPSPAPSSAPANSAVPARSAKPARPPKPVKPVQIEHARAILHAEGAVLWRGTFEFRNVGANIPDLFEKYLLGDDVGAAKTLADAHAVGIRFVRCFGAPWGPEHFDLFENDRARWMSAYDRMLTAADAQGISIVPSLLFNIRMLPDYVKQKSGKAEGVVDFLTPGSTSNGLAVAYVTAIVTRYRNDPRILFWEIGNEYNLEADLSSQWKARPANEIPTSDHVHAFLIQIGTLIKKLDRKHLVTSGNSDMRPSSWHMRQAMLAHRSAADPNNYPMDWSADTFDQYREILDLLNPPPLDLISSHLYRPDRANPSADTMGWLAPDDQHAVRLSWTRAAAGILKKPLFVGEFGESVFEDGKELIPTWTEDFLARMMLGTAPIAAVWAWEFDQNGAPSSYSLSPARTPDLAGLIQSVNQRILVDILGTSTVIIPNPK